MHTFPLPYVRCVTRISQPTLITFTDSRDVPKHGFVFAAVVLVSRKEKKAFRRKTEVIRAGLETPKQRRRVVDPRVRRHRIAGQQTAVRTLHSDDVGVTGEVENAAPRVDELVQGGQLESRYAVAVDQQHAQRSQRVQVADQRRDSVVGGGQVAQFRVGGERPQVESQQTVSADVQRKQFDERREYVDAQLREEVVRNGYIVYSRSV